MGAAKNSVLSTSNGNVKLAENRFFLDRRSPLHIEKNDPTIENYWKYVDALEDTTTLAPAALAFIDDSLDLTTAPFTAIGLYFSNGILGMDEHWSVIFNELTNFIYPTGINVVKKYSIVPKPRITFIGSCMIGNEVKAWYSDAFLLERHRALVTTKTPIIIDRSHAVWAWNYLIGQLMRRNDIGTAVENLNSAQKSTFPTWGEEWDIIGDPSVKLR